MKKFDSISKNYIANNERFADLFNCYIFRGEPVLTAESLEERDAEEIVVPYYGKQYQAVQKFRDILKACVVKEAEDAANLKRLHTDLSQVFGGIRAAAEGAESLRRLGMDPSYRSLSAESAMVLSAAIGLETDIPEEGVVDMCKALEELTRESRDKGRAEGRLEAISESVLALAETLKIGIDQAMDYLKVAPEYREECRRLLGK